MPDHPKHPPVIGISGVNVDSKSVNAMVAKVKEAGGIPIVLANHANRNPAQDIEKLDGLFVMGNDWDIDPNKYINRYPADDPRHQIHPKTVSQADTPASKARADYEEKMLALAAEKKMPVLAVCGGMQTINVMLGGGILQHIPDLIGNDHHEQNTDNIPPYSPVIPVRIDRASELGDILGAGKVPYIYTPSYPPVSKTVDDEVNTFHHQAMDPDMLGKGLRIVASSDPYLNVDHQTRYLPEAIEPDPAGPLAKWPMIGVQWHPEFLHTKESAKLVGISVEHASEYSKETGRDSKHDIQTALIENMKSAQAPLPVQQKPVEPTAPPPVHGQLPAIPMGARQ